MRPYKLPRGAKQRYQECGIRLIRVRTREDARNVGIHLLRPTTTELGNALETAMRDLFPAVYVHDLGTWGYQHGYAFNRRPALSLLQGGAA